MQAKKYPINKWEEDDRPREKLLRKNSTHLSTAELLAILLRLGSKGKSAVDLAREIMKAGDNDLNTIFKLTVSELMAIPGIGMSKATSIVAAFELGRRRHSLEAFDKQKVSNSREVAQHMRTLLRDHPTEVFAVFYMSASNKVRHFHIVSEGTITGTIVDPQLIVKRALQMNCNKMIVCHNHPSGSLQPSAADHHVTKKLNEAARLFDIKLVDHIIVSEEGYFSFADEGLLE